MVNYTNITERNITRCCSHSRTWIMKILSKSFVTNDIVLLIGSIRQPFHETTQFLPLHLQLKFLWKSSCQQYSNASHRTYFLKVHLKPQVFPQKKIFFFVFKGSLNPLMHNVSKWSDTL